MPYRSMPGRPGRRLKVEPGRGAWGQTVLSTEAGHSAMTPAQYGRSCEVEAGKELRRAGWSVTRSHLSRGGADLVATKVLPHSPIAVTRLVQVKSCQVFKPTAFNAGCREILQTPPVWERCLYGYVFRLGHALTITFSADGSYRVDGKPAFVPAVDAAIAAMLRREATRGTTPKRKNRHS